METVTLPCPECGKRHNSSEHDPGYYFICGCTFILVWRFFKDRPPILESISEWPDDDV